MVYRVEVLREGQVVEQEEYMSREEAEISLAQLQEDEWFKGCELRIVEAETP